MEIKTFRNPKATSKAFAEYLYEKHLHVNRLNIALSGGSTPKLLFEILVKKYANKMDWQKFHFYWGDERCVPPTSSDSNYGSANETLFQNIEIPEDNIHQILGKNNPAEEAIRYGQLISEKLPSINGMPQFDIVLLGLGVDGHIASIFPNQMELLTSDYVCTVAEHPISGQKRVTITGNIINNAKEVCFLVTGESKAERVGNIIHSREDHKDYPATHISPTHGELTLFLDKAAAGR